jgi:hypothetical protein
MQPGHLRQDQVQTEQRNGRPDHDAHGNTEHAHHRLFAGTTDGRLRYEEKVRARAHQRNDVH